MADVFSNIQAPSSAPSTPVVQPTPGEFVKSDIKAVAELQTKFRWQIGEILPLVEQQRSFFKAVAWEIGAILGYNNLGSHPEKAAGLIAELHTTRTRVQEKIKDAA